MRSITLNIFLLSLGLFGQEFRTTINKNPVTQGENFQVTFSLNTEGSSFNPPNFSGFKVLQGPSQSQSTRIINGRVSSELSWSYVLKAEKVGNFFIAPASVKSGNKTLKSNRLKVQVVEPSQAEKQRRKQEADREKQLQSQANQIIKDNLYLKIRVNKSSAYIGEQILASYELYANDDLNIVNLDIKDLPKFNGFWTQEFDNEARWEATIENGVRFKKAIIKQVLLYPQQSGELILDPMTWDAVVRLRTEGNQRRRRSIFDDFFDRGSFRDFSYEVNSGSRKVSIKDLPTPSPSDFFGAVGNYKLEAWLDKTQAKTGESITLKLKLEGSGNMKLLSPPELDLPPGFELFEPKMSDNSKSTTSGTSGNVIFEYLMIPRNEGNFKIPPITLSYFDPKSKRYNTLKSDEFNLEIEKGDGSFDQDVITGVNKEDLKYLGKDIRFIKTETKLQKGSYIFLGSILYFISIILGLIMFFVVLAIKRSKDKNQGNHALVKNRKAKRVAIKRLSKAKGFLDNSNEESFYEENIKALSGYISDKLNLLTSDLNKDNIQETLEKSSVDKSLANNIISLIEKCEFARYAPKSDNGSAQSVYEDTISIITKLEEELK